MKKHLMLVTIAGSLALAGCGGGGGGGDAAPAPATPTAVSGVAAKGIVKGAQVLVCRVRSGVPDADASCATGTTGTDGSYNVALSDGWTGPVLVKIAAATGSTMFNEVTGLYDTYAMTMRAVVAAVGATTTVHVTPFSEMAAAAVGATAVTADSINTARSTVQTSLGVDLSVKPVVDLKNNGTDATALGKQISMVKQLAKVLQAARDATAGIKDATGAFCSTKPDPVACALTAMAGVMNGAATLNATTAGSVLNAWNNQNVTTMNIPVIAADGTVKVETGDVTSAASIQTALTSAGMAAADAAAASTEIKTISDTNEANSDTQVAALLAMPATGGMITTTPPTTIALSALAQAKAMVTELRTTFNYYANTAGTGFLNLQGQRMSSDLTAVVQPNLDRAVFRVSTINNGIALYEDAQAAGAAGVTAGTYSLGTDASTTPSQSFYFRQHGSVVDVVQGRGDYSSCRTNSFAAGTSAPVITQVSCAGTRSDNFSTATIPGIANSIGTISFMSYKLTSSSANNYSYTAQKKKVAVMGTFVAPTIDLTPTTTTVRFISGPYNYDTAANTNTLDTACNSTLTANNGTIFACVPYVGSGTVAKTLASGSLTALAVNGTFPPSTYANTSQVGYDTVALSATVTAQSTSTSRVALSGSVVGTETATTSTGVTPDANNTLSMSLDSGSYFDIQDIAATSTTPATSRPTAINVVGTFKTNNTKFTGTLVAGSFLSDADGRSYAPTSMVFNGGISDTSTNGAGEFLTGKLEVAIANFATYHSSLPDSSTNFAPATATFTGKVTATSRPVMQLVLTGSHGFKSAGHQTVSLTTAYTYGTGVSILGSGTLDTVTGIGSLTMTNQDGIKILLATNTDTTVTASDGTTNLATIKSGGIVYYTDGTFDSL